MKSQIIASLGSFVVGTGASLTMLYSWLGTTDLQEIKQAVQNYIVESEQQVLTFVEDYNVTVDNANAEIQDYQVALEQANSNINQLIVAYESLESQAEQDLSDLQAELDKMYERLDSQYEHDINHFIEQANAEIDNANNEVYETKEQVISDISTSQVDEIINGEKHQLVTGGNKEVTSIDSVIQAE